MATMLADGKVLFAGMYPASAKTNAEALLRHISSHYQRAQKKQAQYQLSSAGLTLSVASENGEAPKPIRIPMQNIRDVTVNPYSTVCLMTIFADPKGRINYLVCECRQEQGAAKVVRNFRHFKQTVTGEGYKIDLKKPEGHNWLLKSDQRQAATNGHPAVQHEPEALDRTPTRAGEERLYDVGVQADYGDPDSVSLSSTASTATDTLQTSMEGRDLQDQLKNVSISQPEYIGPERPANGLPPSGDQNGSTPDHVTDGQTQTPGTAVQVHADVHVRKSSSSDGESESTGKHVNFDPVRTVIKPAGYVSRSYGVQTEGKSRFSKRQPPPGGLQFSYGQQRGWILFRSRSRSASSSSNPPSPLSPGPEGHNDVFERPGHRGSARVPGQRPGSVKSTVVRPIEDVYPRTVRRPRSVRSQVVMYPGAVARRTSSSSSGGNTGVPTHNPTPIRPVSFTAPDPDHSDDLADKKTEGNGEVEVKVSEK